MRPDDVIGLTAVLLLFGTPAIAMMLKHQRKMAEMFHAQAVPNAETQMLREEVRELKNLVHQQAIALDNLARPIPSEARIQERVG